MKSTKMNSIEAMAQLVFDCRSEEIGLSRIVHADCFEWLSRIPENSIHAIVTDPPYKLSMPPFPSERELSSIPLWDQGPQ
jgi:predicted methyltransferase